MIGGAAERVVGRLRDRYGDGNGLSRLLDIGRWCGLAMPRS